MEEDEYATCPYNKNHYILKFRMPGHLLKCVKSYNGPKLYACPYNSQHLVKKAEMVEHLRSCDDFHLWHQPEYQDITKKLKQFHPVYDSSDEND